MTSDLKHALRSLLKARDFTLTATATIACCIAAVTILFSVFDQLVLRPVSWPQPDSLVAIRSYSAKLGVDGGDVSWMRFEELRDRVQSFASLADSAPESMTLTGQGDPEQLTVLRVTSGFLPVLGAVPALGRDFTREDDKPGGPNVCLLSYQFWKNRFGGRNELLGSTILLDGQPWEVVGILPPNPGNPLGLVQVVVPRVFEVTSLAPVQVQNGAGYTQPIARLKPGVPLSRANAELDALSRDYAHRFPARLDALHASGARLFSEVLAGGLSRTFYLLLAAMGVVLLIACANVSSLFMARLSARYQEIAVRQALGASRAQLMRQFLAESLVFCAFAGFLGLVLSITVIAGSGSLIAEYLPAGVALRISWPALLCGIAATGVCALLICAVPAWQSSRLQIVDMLRDTTRGSSGGPRAARFREALIVVEVALAVTLFIGSGLLVYSFLQLQHSPAGFNPDGVASAFVGVPQNRYQTKEAQARFFEQVIERLEATPLVHGAAAIIGLPLSNYVPVSPYQVLGQPLLPLAERPLAGYCVVSEEYFAVLRIPLQAGRRFTPQDALSAPNVCIINESFARRLFPGEPAVGKILRRGRDAEIQLEIVGVVSDVKTNGPTNPAPDTIYLPMRQATRPGMTVVVRIDGDPNAAQAALRSAVTFVDKVQAISSFDTMPAAMNRNLGAQRLAASLTGAFAGLSLLLAAIGLYSVLSYLVHQRTGEIGIRMALGAPRSSVVMLIVSSGVKLVLLGLAIGLVVAFFSSRLIAVFLYGVQPFNAAIYGGASILFLLVAALACLMPALRASRIDPMVALRTS